MPQNHQTEKNSWLVSALMSVCPCVLSRPQSPSSQEWLCPTEMGLLQPKQCKKCVVTVRYVASTSAHLHETDVPTCTYYYMVHMHTLVYEQ